MKYSALIITAFLCTASMAVSAQGPGEDNSTSVGATSSTGYSQSSGTNTASGKTYTSTNADENAVQVTGGTFTMTSCTVNKTGGNTSNSDGSSFYGINSAVYSAGSGTIVNMTGGTITTNAIGANSVIAYNSGTVNISDVTINNTANLSRGIHATYKGVINAKNLTITTAGSNSSVVATDRGGGTVTVDGGTYVTTGTDCAILYSTGTITANNASGSSAKGEVGVIEGDNTIIINNCDFTAGSSERGLMILQSGSGDSEGYNGKITINKSKITLTDTNAPLLEVPTNITGTLTLKDVTLTVPSGVLMKVDYNTRWTTNGGTGNLILSTASKATYTGSVVADKYGKANVTVGGGVTWNGAMNNTNVAASSKVTVSGTWNLTADSYVDELVINTGGVVNKNGHTLTAKKTTTGNIIVDGNVLQGVDRAFKGNVYTIDGRLVKSGAENLDGLRPGIYILNGKKYCKTAY